MVYKIGIYPSLLAASETVNGFHFLRLKVNPLTVSEAVKKFSISMIWKIPVNVDEINQRCRNTMCDYLAIEFIEIGDDYMTARMPVDRRTNQPMGILHGGASAALAETVGSAAANYCIEAGKVAVGIDININHMRSVKAGFVTAVAKPLHLGKSTHVWEIKIWNEAKQLIAAARLTIAVINNG